MDYAIGLGSNLGSREGFLQAGLELLAATRGCRLLATSAIYESAPVGPPQPHYLNAAARISSDAEPLELLARLHEIERALGRERREHWGARTLDLDILWAERSLDSPSLQIPHPRLTQRWFALVPLLEVAPELATSFAPLACEGRRLHALALEPWVEVRELGSERVFSARALDLPDALSAALSAAARATWPGLTCKDCEVDVLRVQTSVEASAQTSVTATLIDPLLAALRAHAERGRAFQRVLLCERQAGLDVRVLGAAQHAPLVELAPVALELGSAEACVTVSVRLPRPLAGAV